MAIKNTQFRNGTELLEVVHRTKSNTFYTEEFRDCSPLSLSNRTGEEFNQCVHKGWENKRLIYMTPVWWTNCLKKQEIIHIGVSGKCVRMGFVSQMTATSCQDKPQQNASPRAEKESELCVVLWYCPQLYFKQFCAMALLISRMYQSVCGLPRCIWRTCAAFSEDNLQNKKYRNPVLTAASESSISLSTWADALCEGLSWHDAAVTQQAMKGMSHNSAVNEAASHWMLQLIMCLLWQGMKEGALFEKGEVPMRNEKERSCWVKCIFLSVACSAVPMHCRQLGDSFKTEPPPAQMVWEVGDCSQACRWMNFSSAVWHPRQWCRSDNKINCIAKFHNLITL